MPRKLVPEALVGMPTVGPFSPAVRYGNFVAFSGVIPDIDSETEQPVITDRDGQYRQALEKMRQVLLEADCTPADLIWVMVLYKGSMAGSQAFNSMYNEILEGVAIPPTRCAFAAADLPFGVEIEIVFQAEIDTD